MTTTTMSHAELTQWMDEMEYELLNPFDCLRCNDARFIPGFEGIDHGVCFACNAFHQDCSSCKAMAAASPFNQRPTHQPNGFGGTCLICGTLNYTMTANGKPPAADEAFICSGDCTDAYMAACAGTKGEDW